MANDTDALCMSCKKTIDLNGKKFITCDHCNRHLHQVKKCSSLSASEILEITRNQGKIWFCKPCKINRDKRKSGINNTPTNNGINDVNNPIRSVVSTPILVPTNNSSAGTRRKISLEDLYEIVESKFTDLDNEIRKLKSMVSEYQTENRSLMEANVEMQNENAILREKLDLTNKNYEKLKQKSLEYDIEISGIEQQEDENLNEISEKLFKALEIDSSKVCVREMYRINTGENESGLPPPIMMKLYKMSDKELILKGKKGKTLDTTLIYPKSEKHTIYIYEHLTNHYRYLFKKARDIKRSGAVKFAWYKDGNILIRKTEKSKVIVFNGNNTI